MPDPSSASVPIPGSERRPHGPSQLPRPGRSRGAYPGKRSSTSLRAANTCATTLWPMRWIRDIRKTSPRIGLGYSTRTSTPRSSRQPGSRQSNPLRRSTSLRAASTSGSMLLTGRQTLATRERYQTTGGASGSGRWVSEGAAKAHDEIGRHYSATGPCRRPRRQGPAGFIRPRARAFGRHQVDQRSYQQNRRGHACARLPLDRENQDGVLLLVQSAPGSSRHLEVLISQISSPM